MNFYYLDTNAFIKLLLPQRGHDLLQDLFDKDENIFIISTLSITEVHSALKNQEKGGNLKKREYTKAKDKFVKLLKDNIGKKIKLVPIDTNAYNESIPLIEKHSLHSLDALHFYTALKYKGAGITFVTEDKDLKKASVAEEIEIFEFEKCICKDCGSPMKQVNETTICSECEKKTTKVRMICSNELCKHECFNCNINKCKKYNLSTFFQHNVPDASIPINT